MAAEVVPQKVLNWLHSVLIGEYADVNRSYSDAAQALTDFTSLRPSTDVYTFENGYSNLLLRVSGTLPVHFRGTVYSFPVSIWIPQSYPREAPIALVNPTRDMVIRPGQHVSSEGRIYHPYLAGWRPERYSISAFLRILQEVFSREPPVISKKVQAPPMPRQTSMSPPAPPTPPRPPKPSGPIQGDNSASDRGQDGTQPPEPPPKPFKEQMSSEPRRIDSAPPIPPQSPFSSPQSVASPWSPSGGFSQLESNQQTFPRPTARYDSGPLSPSASARPTGWDRPIPQGPTQDQRKALYYARPPPEPPRPHQRSQPSEPSQASQPYPNRPQYYPQPQNHLGNPQMVPPHQPTQRQRQQSATPKVKPPPPEDLLTSPFDPPLPTQPANIPAPPIPPNPEKDALLSSISHALTERIQASVSSNSAALQPLSAQHAAMTNALYNLQQEQAALSSLQSFLASNEKDLHTAMRDADACIAKAQHSSVPGVDEVLVAPTIVGQQLYDLVAEEKACADAREVLGRALDRGRLGSEAWVKAVRSLAREEFLKKVLIKKCADGMGLRSDNEAQWS